MAAKLVNGGNGQIFIETDKGRSFNVTTMKPLDPNNGWSQDIIQMLGLMIDFFAMENYNMQMNLTTGVIAITRKP